MENPMHIMKTPRDLDLEITSRCNLRCRYCYYFDNEASTYNDLSVAEWQRFFAECEACAIMSVTLAGGEPFARPDLMALLDSIVEHRMRFAILTNGTLLTDEWAVYLKNTGRCDYVQVSIDGSGPETHDICRGQGAFANALRGLEILQRHGLPISVRVTIHHFNVDDLEAIARLLLDQLGLPNFSTNAAGYLGSCRQHSADIQLTTADRDRAMASLVRLAARYPGRISANAGPLADARMWSAMETARRSEAPPTAGTLSGCGCTFSKLAVRADGAYVPCCMLPHLELGRVNQERLIDIWQNHPQLQRMRERSRKSLRDFEFCADCQYAAYCTGNCPALAHTLTGEMDAPSPDACLRRFLADGGHLPE